MTKQKRGIFRRTIDRIRTMLGMPVTRHYADPLLRDPYHHRRSVRSKDKALKIRLKYPMCVPGTIAFHDKCVRYYGARKAAQINRDIQHKDIFGNPDRMDRVPTEANFLASEPWAWRRS